MSIQDGVIIAGYTLLAISCLFLAATFYKRMEIDRLSTVAYLVFICFFATRRAMIHLLQNHEGGRGTGVYNFVTDPTVVSLNVYAIALFMFLAVGPSWSYFWDPNKYKLLNEKQKKELSSMD